MNGLTAFQAEVTRLFFSLPASDEFLLAGGAALLAAQLTTRPTDDLDFFGTRDGQPERAGLQRGRYRSPQVLW